MWPATAARDGRRKSPCSREKSCRGRLLPETAVQRERCKRERPRGDSRPRLSGEAKLRCFWRPSEAHRLGRAQLVGLDQERLADRQPSSVSNVINLLSCNSAVAMVVASILIYF